MRLEILTENKDPVIYVLNRPEIYIGSNESNDIVISSTEISKKHLKLIITDEGKCFAIDQGSTNGSFINDVRLIPGKREEFQLLNSMRLGDKVLLTLLDKEKGGDFPELPLREQFAEENKVKIADEDKTRIISLKTLQKTKTEKVKKKRLKKLEKELKKKKRAREDKATVNRALITAMVIVALGWGAMKFVSSKRKKKNNATVVSQMKETQIMIDDSLESIEENIADVLIENSELLSIADISKHAEDVNCSLPDEIFFCKRMPRGNSKKNGAINLNGQVVIYLEQKEWLAKAQALVASHAELNSSQKPVIESSRVEDAMSEEPSSSAAPAPEETGNASMDILNRIAFLSYLKKHLSTVIPPEIRATNVYVAFYTSIGGTMNIESVSAIKGQHIRRLNARYTEDFFRFKKYDPYRIIKKLDRFYKTY